MPRYSKRVILDLDFSRPGDESSPTKSPRQEPQRFHSYTYNMLAFVIVESASDLQAPQGRLYSTNPTSASEGTPTPSKPHTHRKVCALHTKHTWMWRKTNVLENYPPGASCTTGRLSKDKLHSHFTALPPPFLQHKVQQSSCFDIPSAIGSAHRRPGQLRTKDRRLETTRSLIRPFLRLTHLSRNSQGRATRPLRWITTQQFSTKTTTV